MRRTGNRAIVKDVQNMYDPRNIKIDKVGVKNVKYPIVVLDKSQRHPAHHSRDQHVREPSPASIRGRT